MRAAERPDVDSIHLQQLRRRPAGATALLVSMRGFFRTGETDTARLEAFSDGVLAIVIALLILEVRIPQNVGNNDALWAALPRAAFASVPDLKLNVSFIRRSGCPDTNGPEGNHHMMVRIL